ncbi:MAG TPA: PAS domain S-box protein [Myxococcota bacterium]|nr:PAS domain S-box protein [Myxococcota bacterium]
MSVLQARALPRAIGSFWLGLCALALVTLLCFQLGFDATATAFVYLVVIVALSLVGSFIPLAALSVLGVASLSYFFAPPRFSFMVGNRQDVVVLGAFLIAALVTTRLVNRSTRAARLSEERARLLDLTHDAVIIRDMQSRIVYWNRGAERLYGWSATETLGRFMHEFRMGPESAADREAKAQLLQTGSLQRELWHTTRDGKRLMVEVSGALERDESGRPVAVLLTLNDITERKRAEDALRKSEERWRAVFEHNPTMYFMLDPAGTVISVNPFGAEQLGYTVEELVGRSVLDVFIESHREAARRHVADCLAHPGQALSWELRKLRRDGTMLWVRETARAMRTADDEVVVLVVCEDITQRKRAEDELRASETRFRTLVDHASDAFFMHDERGTLIDVNRQACEGLGYTRDELVGMSRADFISRLTTTDDEDAKGIRERYATSDIATLESRHRRKDGTLFPVEARMRQFRSEDGHQFGIALVRDITDRKQAEQSLREAQAALAHVTRVTTLGEVTASFAHELNQPLAAIANNANACHALLAEGIWEADELREALADIVSDAERASAIIERVRALAKRSAPERTELRLGEVVRDVLALAAAESAARQVTIRTDLAADLPVVMGDRVQLQQVLLNLVVNAMDAMAGVDESERRLEIRGQLDMQDGRPAVTIRVEDCGIGLKAEEADRLFEPFYTTKPHGMGLGLAISRSILEAHGGRLWAESNPGRGAVFSFLLPARGRSPLDAGPGPDR